jgi:hypothetical protein
MVIFGRLTSGSGTSLTSRDVRLESAKRANADIDHIAVANCDFMSARPNRSWNTAALRSRTNRLGPCGRIRRMGRFLQRHDRGEGQAVKLRRRCRNLRCTKPRTTSPGYGYLIKLIAAGFRGSKERMGRISLRRAASWASVGCVICCLMNFVDRARDEAAAGNQLGRGWSSPWRR